VGLSLSPSAFNVSPDNKHLEEAMLSSVVGFPPFLVIPAHFLAVSPAWLFVLSKNTTPGFSGWL
jgi:hypothetical protein